MSARPPACLRCRHFFVTWEQPCSKGCRAYGFKSERYPSVVVLESSGSECRQFEPTATLATLEKRGRSALDGATRRPDEDTGSEPA